MFAGLIAKLKEDSVNILFFKGAYHPVFYSRICNIKGVVEGERFLDDYANKNHINIIGSYNPKDVSFDNSDFYDAAHARKESLDKLFDN